MTGEAKGLLPVPPRPVGGIRFVLMGGSMPGIDIGVPGSWKQKNFITSRVHTYWYILVQVKSEKIFQQQLKLLI